MPLATEEDGGLDGASPRSAPPAGDDDEQEQSEVNSDTGSGDDDDDDGASPQSVPLASRDFAKLNLKRLFRGYK